MIVAEDYPDILIASTYIFCTIVFADLLRYSITENIGNPNDSLLSKCVQEFIATVELCSVCYELGFALDLYGPVMYGLYSFITGAWLILNWGDTVSADPFKLIIDFFRGAVDFWTMTLVIGAQILGCSLFYNMYLKKLWGLGFGIEHMNKLNSLATGCSSEVTGTVLQATLAESLSLMMIILTSKLIEQERFTVVSSAFLNSFITVCFEMAILNISGGFLSPLIASGFEFACAENVKDHLIMFWIGPFFGELMAELIYKTTST